MTASPIHADALVDDLRDTLQRARTVNSTSALFGVRAIERLIARIEQDASTITALQARLAVPEGATGELVEAIGRALTRTADLAAGAGWTLEERSAMYADTGKLARAAATIAAQEQQIVALREVAKYGFHKLGMGCRRGACFCGYQGALDALSAARQAPHSEGGGGGK